VRTSHASDHPRADASLDEADTIRDNPRRRREARGEREDNDRHGRLPVETFPPIRHRTLD